MKKDSNEKVPISERKEFFEDRIRSVEFSTEVTPPTEHTNMLKHEKRQLDSD
ncbi:hypothetical protein [Bacillus sp. Marseille-P3661]|uniref:hypothetical protein n=1 Tax=Bacillus sp. Marseille-P3661 TaxID=1936234 RepID=UPI0015E1A0B5|nr:hypothetical protein [Bacillus sp. Marseille-P3661]